MEFDVHMRDDSASLNPPLAPWTRTTPAKLYIEWRAVEAAESTALVRTRAEAKLAKETGHG